MQGKEVTYFGSEREKCRKCRIVIVQIKENKGIVLGYRVREEMQSKGGPRHIPAQIAFRSHHRHQNAFDDASMPMDALVYKRHAVEGDWVSVQACPMVHWP